MKRKETEGNEELCAKKCAHFSCSSDSRITEKMKCLLKGSLKGSVIHAELSRKLNNRLEPGGGCE